MNRRIFPPGDPRALFHTPAADMIDVWRVHEPETKGGCIFDSEADAQQMLRNEKAEDATFVLVITKEQMDREAFETLGEFDGF